MKARDYILPEGYKIKGTNVVFNLEEIYKFCMRWFEHNGWTWAELSYRDSTRSDGGKTIEYNWEARKEFDKYISFVITMDVLTIAKEIEIEEGGRKLKKMKGLIEFSFSAYLEKSEEKFGKGESGKFLRKMYEKYVIRKKIEDAEEVMYREIIELINELKAFLSLHSVE
ncbi:hypothetical protein HY498_05475 [Candidatus Woesearchaeota archaeon]|nr:hypothetical protein [Candidatus Woesearchaeota archaeon]